jgi:peptidoglycan/xylan/chitin deacetylase (PgdA/CDA1 family)
MYVDKTIINMLKPIVKPALIIILNILLFSIPSIAIVNYINSKQNLTLESINRFNPIVISNDEIKKKQASKIPRQLKLPIVMYHSIANFSAISPQDKNKSFARNFRIPPSVFAKQLDLLIKNNYNTITFKELEDYEAGLFEMPSNPIILTFDDGWSDQYNTIIELKKRNLKGSFALITNLLDKPDRLNDSQVKELISYGNELTSHTVDHPDLTRVSPEKLTKELLDSKDYLKSKFNYSVNTIVYPTGAHNQTVINESKKLGYKYGVTTKTFVNNIDLSKPFELTRVRTQCETTTDLRADICNNLGNDFFSSLKK